MTLSSNSRQNRKSMLPTPRLSSRLSSRRAASGETFRGARSVPSPLLVTPASFNKGSAMHSRAPYLAAAMSRRLQLPELGSRRAGSPSRIPLPSLAGGQVSYPTTLEHSVASASPIGIPLEERKAGAHYPTPPASVEAKHERAYKGQDRDASSTPVQQQQSNNARVPAPPPPIPTQHVYRRPASTTLTITPALSQIENSSLGSSAPHALAMKKSALTSSVSGKENRRPKSRMRVPVLSPTPASTPVAPIASVPPRPSQQLLTQVSRASSRETLPRPLVVRKRLRDAFSPNSDSSREGSQAKSPVTVIVPTGIKALMSDLDRFAKEWTGMFDELYADADDGRVEATTDAEMPIHPVPESEVAGLHPTWTRKQTGYQETRGAGIGKNESREPDENRAVLSTTSESTVSVNSSQGSSLVSGDGETVNFDVTAASLVRWQHRDNTMLKDAPVETKSKADIPDMVPASPPSYPPTDTASRHSQKAGFRSAPSPITPQISRYPPLPEINQSPIISGSHLVEMTSTVLSNRKDGFTKLLESPPTPTNGTDAARRNVATMKLHLPTTVTGTLPTLSSSSVSTTVSLGSMPIPHTSSPLAHLHPRAHDPAPQYLIHVESERVPTRSSSMRGLRAIFKRTSAGLAGGQRQRAESLKERISEPTVLSLGSLSISNFRDAGVTCASEVSGALDSIEPKGDLIRKTTAIKG